MMEDFQHILKIAVHIARHTGAILLEGFGKADQVNYKGEVDLVTNFDNRAEVLIVSSLREAFPAHGIYAEEQGVVDTGESLGPYHWMIDPLDGTTNYAHGFPPFAVSMALRYISGPEDPLGEPVVGIVYDPIHDECFTAVRGQGAKLNGRSIRCSNAPTLNTALLGTGFAYDRRTRTDNNTGHFSQVIRRCQGIRRAGCAAVDLAYVACGRLDGFWELRLHPWDVAAGILLIQEAGGHITDLSGGSDYFSGEQIVASNGRIHDELLTVLRLGDIPA